MKRISALLVGLLMILSASFKIFNYGTADYYFSYPIPKVLSSLVPYAEIIAGSLFLIGVRKEVYRKFGLVVLFPLMIGAMASHICFGWLGLFGGTHEPYYFILPSIFILILAIWSSKKR